MKMAKTLVLTVVLAMTGYVYASGTDQTTTTGAKPAACSSDSCCKAKQDCCRPGAACCQEGAQCCSDKGCCGEHSCKDGEMCCAAGKECANGQCCSKESGCCSKADPKSCCGTACKKPATVT